MDEPSKAHVVAMLQTGASNLVIAQTLGLTVNQVGGLRYRTFGRTMSQREALMLPKARYGTNQTVGPVLSVLSTARYPQSSGDIAQVLGYSRHRVYMALRQLLRAGVVVRSGRSPNLMRYRLAVAEAAE